MGFKLTGLGELTKNLEQLKKALDGEVADLRFDPHMREDVDRAIRRIEQRVDIKVAPYISSPGAREIATQLKEECRKAILQKVEDARKTSPA